MLQKTINKFKTGNKKDRHWILFTMLIFSWLIGMLGLAMVKYNYLELGKLLAVIGILSGFVFILMGFWNMLFGPNEEHN
ncbi:MAG: hypothetical protein GKR92_02475 [Gammaproteobacteria bacterium]|nr:MAG: hypothetical protein GKR92_02475 [Gammaproteobacteria bacterium]